MQYNSINYSQLIQAFLFLISMPNARNNLDLVDFDTPYRNTQFLEKKNSLIPFCLDISFTGFRYSYYFYYCYSKLEFSLLWFAEFYNFSSSSHIFNIDKYCECMSYTFFLVSLKLLQIYIMSSCFNNYLFSTTALDAFGLPDSAID
jgi:hypothetical protein